MYPTLAGGRIQLCIQSEEVQEKMSEEYLLKGCMIAVECLWHSGDSRKETYLACALLSFHTPAQGSVLGKHHAIELMLIQTTAPQL